MVKCPRLVLSSATRTAKVYPLASHNDGQLPFAAMSRHVQKEDAVIATCQNWISDNYSIANPVAAMTERSGLIPRTFACRFRARIDEAMQSIETDDNDIDEIGAQVGYEGGTFFRRLFKRRVGLTPAAYRCKFARTLLHSTSGQEGNPVAGAFTIARRWARLSRRLDRAWNCPSSNRRNHRSRAGRGRHFESLTRPEYRQIVEFVAASPVPQRHSRPTTAGRGDA